MTGRHQLTAGEVGEPTRDLPLGMGWRSPLDAALAYGAARLAGAAGGAGVGRRVRRCPYAPRVISGSQNTDGALWAGRHDRAAKEGAGLQCRANRVRATPCSMLPVRRPTWA